MSFPKAWIESSISSQKSFLSHPSSAAGIARVRYIRKSRFSHQHYSVNGLNLADYAIIRNVLAKAGLGQFRATRARPHARQHQRKTQSHWSVQIKHDRAAVRPHQRWHSEVARGLPMKPLGQVGRHRRMVRSPFVRSWFLHYGMTIPCDGGSTTTT